VHRLVGQLVGCLVGMLVGWLVSQWVSHLIAFLVDQSVGWSIAWSVICSVCGLVRGLFGLLVGLLFGWSVCHFFVWWDGCSVCLSVLCAVDWLVGLWFGGLVGVFQPRRDLEGMAPGAVWTGLENLLPTSRFNPQTGQIVKSHKTHITKPGESRYTSTLPSALGHQWITSSRQIISGKESPYPL